MGSAPEKSLRHQLAAEARLAKYNSHELTKAARAVNPGSDAYWEAQVDPRGELDPADRKARAQHAKKAYFLRLALKSHKARRKAAERKTAPEPSHKVPRDA